MGQMTGSLFDITLFCGSLGFVGGVVVSVTIAVTTQSGGAADSDSISPDDSPKSATRIKK